MMEKKHAATQKKIKDARKEGQVSKSQDLLRLASLAVAFEVASAFREPVSNGLITLFSRPSELMLLPFDEAAERMASFAVIFFFAVAFTAMGILILVKVGATWAQSGFVFTTAPLKPSLSRLNPVKQLSQMFSANKLWDLFAGILKIVLIAGLGVVVLKHSFADILGMSSFQSIQLWEGIHRLMMPVAITLLLLLVALSLLDVIMQRHFYQKRLKMSEQEVKQEKKSQEGDPLIKSKRRLVAQQLLADNPAPSLDVIKNADAVVVNPTHIAIAISYKPGETPLPVILYKSEDGGALDAIAYAQQHNVPVIRYLWLARTLHRTSPVGIAIPRETIQAAAAEFRVIKQLAASEFNPDDDGSGIIELNSG